MQLAKTLAQVVLMAFLGSVVQAHELTFLLVPQDDWNQGQPAAEAFLTEGKVLLFQHGAFEPELVIEANQPQTVPSGIWYWIAEAPGYVSTTSGVVRLVDEEPINKRLIWSVVPACEVDLQRLEWRGISRLDLVSLDHHATYPITRNSTSTRWIPAGRFLAYTTNPQGIGGISPIDTCRPGDLLELSRPEPPANDRQALVASVRLPQTKDDEPGVEKDLLQAFIEPLGNTEPNAPLSPDAVVWAEDRATFFFLDLEAEPIRLTFEDPTLRSARLELPATPGEVQEPEERQLQHRVTVDLTIDYRPQRSHPRQELVMLRCGDQPRRHLVELDRRSCQQIGQGLALKPGIATYRLQGLDLGWHVPSARFEAEELPGLGTWTSLEVDEETPSTLTLNAHLLEEFQIHGHLLVDGEPVPGEVRLEPMADFSGQARSYPTDDELLYRMFYFAQEPLDFGLRRLPEEVQQRDPHSLRGLFFGHRLSACDGEGFCKLFHMWSTLSGEGRLDFELGAPSVSIRVIDAMSREPIAGAMAAFSHQGQGHETFHFVAGEHFVGSRPAGEALATFTNSSGEIRVRDVEAGSRRLVVQAAGYARGIREVMVPTTGHLDLEIELEALSPRGGLTLRFPDGRAASGVVLLALEREGAPDYRCTRAANGFGELKLPEPCLEEERVFLLLHPGVTLERISTAMLRQSGEIQVSQAPAQPRRIRMASASGLPLAFASVRFRVQGITLTPNHLLAAASRGGFRLPFRTDHRGELTLTFLDPTDPTLEIALSPSGDWWTLAGPVGSIEEVLVD